MWQVGDKTHENIISLLTGEYQTMLTYFLVVICSAFDFFDI